MKFNILKILILIAISCTCVIAQANNTPEIKVKGFYSWYLKSIVKDATEKKTFTKSYFSRRFSLWYFSKAGQNADYDVFLDGQEWSDAWEDNMNIGTANIKGNKAVLKVILSSPPPEDLLKTLRISLVKESGIWKIDRVKSL
ncbi:hypothetical protein BH10ACI3_BH10ACI3_28220 [soil metagenome]